MPPLTQPELTFRAAAWGLALGSILVAANVYAGLELGVIDAGATTIVLASFAAFGAGRRRFGPLEVNVAQAAGASAATMAVTAGLIGPIPALAATGHDVAPVAIALWGAALAVFGTLIAIPFRAAMLQAGRLAFPSARATGELIRRLFVDADRGAAVAVLVGAGLAAAGVAVLRDGLHLVPGRWLLPVSIAGVPAAGLAIGVSLSPLVVGVGILVGARTGLGLIIGSIVAWIVIAPQLVGAGLATASYPSLVSWTLWPGAALMLASSLTSLALAGRSLLRRPDRSPTTAWSWRWSAAALLTAVAIVGLGWGALGVSPWLGALALALAAACAVAGMQATGETDQTPAGPLGGLTQIVVGAIGPGGVGAPLGSGGVVNGTTVHAATMMNTWKTTELVEGSPRRALVAQLAGIAAGAVVGVLAYWVIREAYGIGTLAMPAPAAMSWKATAEAVARGTAGMPAGAPLAALIAALAGVALTVVDRLASETGRLRRWLPSPTAIGVGFILPAATGTTLALAALAFAVVAARAPTWYRRTAAPLASGLIVGEAFAGVVIAAVTLARTVG